MNKTFHYPKTQLAPNRVSMRVVNVLIIKTKADLFEVLGMAGTQNVSVNGVVGILWGVEREDGSGNSFIVRLLGHDNKIDAVYFRG